MDRAMPRTARDRTLMPSGPLKKMLARVFDSMREEDRKRMSKPSYETKRRDFVFHMTDWLQDLEELSELYANPGKHRSREACVKLISILGHLVPHLNTAGRLLLDHISDPFADEYV